jgi:hypothetical protein
METALLVAAACKDITDLLFGFRCVLSRALLTP